MTTVGYVPHPTKPSKEEQPVELSPAESPASAGFQDVLPSAPPPVASRFEVLKDILTLAILVPLFLAILVGFGHFTVNHVLIGSLVLAAFGWSLVHSLPRALYRQLNNLELGVMGLSMTSFWLIGVIDLILWVLP